MKQIDSIKRYAVIGAALAGLLATAALAQTYAQPAATGAPMGTSAADISRIAARVASLQPAVSALAGIESRRQSIAADVVQSLSDVGHEVQDAAAMPVATDADKQAVSQKIADASAKVGALAPVVQGLAAVRSGEIDILQAAGGELMRLERELG